MGSTVAGVYALTGLMDGTMHYRHDVGSLQGLWREVEAKTGTKWKV
jgi:D-alanyl-D-alanine carboxypeptidase